MSLLPPISKLGDAITAINALGDALDAITRRVEAVEQAATVVNDARITRLEAFMAAHQAGANKRQTEVDRLTAENERLRYQLRTGRPA